MTQFSDAEGQAKKRKVTRREKFLSQMNKLSPWSEIEKPIERYYLTSLTGRKPFPLFPMLRFHYMKLFYNLSDLALEYALYDILFMRQFSGITIDTVPGETIILDFDLYRNGTILVKSFSEYEQTFGEKRPEL
jgi:IS5 family transposase